MFHLRTSHTKAISLLANQIEEIQKIQKNNLGEFNLYGVIEFIHTTARLLETIYGENDKHSADYTRIINGISPDKPGFGIHVTNVSRAILRSNIKEIQLNMENPEFQEPIKDIKSNNSDETILFIFSKFHNIAKILERNRKNCSCFSINNEYDVQLLIYSLLTLGFEHIRVEEPTGSHAGSASRMDFVLDDEKTIIEIKYAFEGHVDNEIGKELLLDIAKYGANGKYSKFFCLIYDPNNKIRNAPILKKDLEAHKGENFDITVVIEPKR